MLLNITDYVVKVATESPQYLQLTPTLYFYSSLRGKGFELKPKRILADVRALYRKKNLCYKLCKMGKYKCFETLLLLN